MPLSVTPISRVHAIGVALDHADVGLRLNERLSCEEEEYYQKEAELQRRDLDTFQRHRKEQEVAEAQTRASQEDLVQQKRPTIPMSYSTTDQVHRVDEMDQPEASGSTLVGEFVEEECHPPIEPPSPPHHHPEMDQWFYRYAY